MADIAEPVLGSQGMDRLAAAPAPPAASAGPMAAWVLTVVVLAAAVASAVTWRDSVIRAWPPSGRILALFGPAATVPAQIANKKAE